jgi:polysaccharide pyruvyl transferase WcaK-like protein/coenzyme F420-reducing hydrogenase beta subunit
MKFAAWTKDREALKKASSGGIFYELAEYFVSNGGVVCGVIMEGMTPEFIMTSNLEDIKKMRGSKYLWANPVPIFECMNDPKVPILFVGLPCQVIGLKRYLKNRNIPDKHITYVSLRCHGVINTKTFQDYIKWIENVTKIAITNIKFREEWQKGAGLSITYDNQRKTVFFKPKLIKDYIKKRNVFPMCKTCNKDRNDSDITLGDFWGCHPALKNKYGTSIMETNTLKGYNLFKSIAHKLHWKFVPKDLADIPVDSDKIGLLKVADFRNFGNLMLSSNFITYMKAVNKDAEFVFIENESAQDVIEKATGVTDIEYRHIETLSRFNFKKVLFDTFIGLVNPQEMEQVKVFADCKHVAVLGGDRFSGGIHYATWIINLIRLNALAKCGKEVHIVSNTVGKFPWFLRPFVKHVFNNLQAIWCRDTDSVDRCQAVGIKGNLWYAPDLAFLPLHNELKEEIFGVKDEYCTIVTTALWKQYANTYDEYISGVKHMAQALILLTHKNVMILPHSTYPSDIQIARDVADNNSIFALVGEEPMTPSKARAVLANSFLNVSFRMHGAISSLESDVPVVAIAYSPKYKGVISDGFNLPELVVEKMSRRNWQKCVAKTIETIKYAVENNGTLSFKILKTSMQKVSDTIFPLHTILEESQ